jgi:arylsulfatase B
MAQKRTIPNPSRRGFLGACLTGATSLMPAQSPPGPPNVILIMTDDQGYGDLGCHGNPAIRTPNLDELHKESVRLTNYHVSPTCSPTRSALMTGRYTNATGAWHTIMGRSLLRHDETTLAESLRRGGYRTGIFGKWHLGDNYPCRPQDKGFEETLVHGGGGIYQTPDWFGNDYSDDTYWHNGKPTKFAGFCTDVWFENAMRFMKRSAQAGKPFFTYIPTNAPHGPMWAPDSYSAMYRDVKGLRDPGFYGMITNIDDNVGKLRGFLKETGLEANTILIFTTDNGTAAGANVFNAGMRGQKGSAYEGGHRVPFFLRWPKGGLAQGRDIDTLAAHIDVLPTLLDLCGVKHVGTKQLHGKSLRPLLHDSKPRWPERAIVVDSQRLEHLVKWRQTAVLTSRWRLVNPTPEGNPSGVELYDIRQDPGQRNNVAAANPAVVGELTKEYEAWWAKVSPGGPEYVRIVVGNDAENPARLTAHDWHGEGVNEVWNQGGIRRAAAVNGFWAVEVDREADYRIELRRWPKEVDLPIQAAYKDSEPNRETAPGKAIEAVEARLRIAGIDRKVAVRESDHAAVFRLRLRRGPAKLETWFYQKNGVERGAYYVYVERLSG